MYIITYACNPSGTGMGNLNKYTYSYMVYQLFSYRPRATVYHIL